MDGWMDGIEKKWIGWIKKRYIWMVGWIKNNEKN